MSAIQGAAAPQQLDSTPRCPVCTETLGTHGGPCSLPCGHNGCFHCLKDVQRRRPECPLCRSPFPSEFTLRQNPVLDQLVKATAFSCGGAEEDGWERVPSRANTVHMYAQDLAHTLMGPASHRVAQLVEEADGDADERECDIDETMSRSSAGAATITGAGASSGGDLAPVGRELVLHNPQGRGHAPVQRAPASLSVLMGSYSGVAADGPRYSFEAILSWVPPQWMPDSCAPACKACSLPFAPVIRLRHHCRLCGLVFCHACSGRRLLLPPKFGYCEPQRVCDSCYDVMRPASLQNALAGHFSKAAQAPVHDVTDWTSLRAWLNNPLTSSLEQDIYKCSNILGQFTASSRFSIERTVPASLLQHAAGYAILSVLRIGCGWSAAVGTGLVVGRLEGGGWSPPSAIGLGSCGWGMQAGGQLTDLLLVLPNRETLKAFCGDVHLGVSGNVNVAVGPVGRDASAAVSVGRRGCAMAYSYSCSRGAFVGISVDGTVTHTRSNANLAFYGRPLTAKDLLLGGVVEAPPAARTLYAALDGLLNSFDYSQLAGQRARLAQSAAVGAALQMPPDATYAVDEFEAVGLKGATQAASAPALHSSDLDRQQAQHQHALPVQALGSALPQLAGMPEAHAGLQGMRSTHGSGMLHSSMHAQQVPTDAAQAPLIDMTSVAGCQAEPSAPVPDAAPLMQPDAPTHRLVASGTLNGEAPCSEASTSAAHNLLDNTDNVSESSDECPWNIWEE